MARSVEHERAVARLAGCADVDDVEAAVAQMHRRSSGETAHSCGVEHFDANAHSGGCLRVHALTYGLGRASRRPTERQDDTAHHQQRSDARRGAANQATSFHSETVSG